MRSRQADETVGDREDDARGAERDEASARRRWRRRRPPRPRCRRRRRRPECAARRSPRPPRPRARDRPRLPSPRPGSACARAAGRWRRAARRPSAGADVEPQRAGGVRHFRDRFAGQPQPHIVLRQQDALGRGEHLRLVLGDPQRFRRGEAGHRDVAGAAAKVGNAAFRAPRIRRRSGRRSTGSPDAAACRAASRKVAPCIWPERPTPASRANASGALLRNAATPVVTAVDPVVGVLLAPQRLRSRQRQRHGGVGDRALLGVDQQRLDRRSADVQPKKGFARADCHDLLLPTPHAPLNSAAR